MRIAVPEALVHDMPRRGIASRCDQQCSEGNRANHFEPLVGGVAAWGGLTPMPSVRPPPDILGDGNMFPSPQ